MKKPLKKKRVRLFLHSNRYRIPVVVSFIFVILSYIYNDIKMLAVGASIVYGLNMWNKK